MIVGENAFNFVKIDMPPEKPRSVGVIEIRGPYYTSLSYGYKLVSQFIDDSLRARIVKAIANLESIKIRESTGLLEQVKIPTH